MASLFLIYISNFFLNLLIWSALSPNSFNSSSSIPNSIIDTEKITVSLKNHSNFKNFIKEDYYSLGFGKSINSETYKYEGNFNSGESSVELKIIIK